MQNLRRFHGAVAAASFAVSLALPTLVPAALTQSAMAQTPTYTVTRDACMGDPVVRCLAQNDQPPLSLWYSTSPSDYAFPVVNNLPYPVQVLGFEFWTSSVTGVAETVSSHLYRDASGAGAIVPTLPAAQPTASGSITVNGYNAWWSTSVYPAAVLQPGEVFWVGFFATSRISPPINQNGTGAVAGAVHRRANVNNNAWLPYSTNGFPAIRMRCTSPAPAVPQLGNLDLPRIGQPFRLSVTNGFPTTPVFMVWAVNSTSWGGQPLPFNLSGMGAPDCFVHTSSDATLLLITDPSGQVTQTVTLPNNPGLVGVTVYHQAALFSNVNALNLVTTNMGRAVLGL